MISLFLCLAPAIHDGDNIRCADRSMRLAAIDAPDFRSSPKCRRVQPGVWCDDAAAIKSRDHLRSLIFGRPVRCRVVDASPFARGFQAFDRYNRPVVKCWSGGIDLSKAQLSSGNARPWPSNTERYIRS